MEILRKGCQGRSVVKLQDELKRLGFPVSTDGVFGQQTYLAVMRFQSARGLVADGVVGKDTWEMPKNTTVRVISRTNMTKRCRTLI
ncbi:MAG: peptidoglycan-binding protein [Mediterranea sp.]|jgi:peptidoglycan hydrolase-like protein with peptidoglycan-binding domain|nr:peptidoglycan-binding protein [Mediterranea sp.]